MQGSANSHRQKSSNWLKMACFLQKTPKSGQRITITHHLRQDRSIPLRGQKQITNGGHFRWRRRGSFGGLDVRSTISRNQLGSDGRDGFLSSPRQIRSSLQNVAWQISVSRRCVMSSAKQFRIRESPFLQRVVRTQSASSLSDLKADLPYGRLKKALQSGILIAARLTKEQSDRVPPTYWGSSLNGVGKAVFSVRLGSDRSGSSCIVRGCETPIFSSWPLGCSRRGR